MEDIELFGNTGLTLEEKEKVISRLPEFHRTSLMIGHSTSQTSYTLQTLNMISDSPMSRLKQCLAQINKRYQALRENHFKIEKMKLEVKELQKKHDEYSKLDMLDKSTLIEEITKGMIQSFKQIGMFQDMYDTIIKNNNIPVNWTEKDFEQQEIENMIRSSFRIAIQDLSNYGRVSRAAVEFWEQLGIHPQMGEKRSRDYLINTQDILDKLGTITIQLMYDFLDEMVREFGESHKLALKRIGLETIGSNTFMSDGATKPQ